MKSFWLADTPGNHREIKRIEIAHKRAARHVERLRKIAAEKGVPAKYVIEKRAQGIGSRVQKKPETINHKPGTLFIGKIRV